jgi:predicted  nucleic acid-binding Zn-ribbon protein
MRMVECPFKDIGCIKEIRAIDLRTHVIEDSPAHLLLAVARMAEHQEVIRKLYAEVQTLQDENRNLREHARKHEQESKQEVAKLQSQVTKMNKELTQLDKSCKKEFSRIHTLRD